MKIKKNRNLYQFDSLIKFAPVISIQSTIPTGPLLQSDFQVSSSFSATPPSGTELGDSDRDRFPSLNTPEVTITTTTGNNNPQSSPLLTDSNQGSSSTPLVTPLSLNDTSFSFSSSSTDLNNSSSSTMS